MHRRLVSLFFSAVLVSWLGAGALLCERTLRVPRKTDPQIFHDRDPAYENVHIAAADGVVLRGSFLPAGKPNAACVLLLHGIADSRASALGFSGMFVEAGYSVLAIDSRAHGSSGGELVTYGLLERRDVLHWAEWLRSRGCPRLFGLGESLGGAILIQAAAQEPVFTAIVAECPFSDLRTIAEDRVAQLLPGPRLFRRLAADAAVASAFLYARVRYGLDMRAVSPAVSAARLTTPLLLIHGLKDTKTDPAHSLAIAAAGQTIEVWLVPGAGHTSAAAQAPVEFKTRVLGWFEFR